MICLGCLRLESDGTHTKVPRDYLQVAAPFLKRKHETLKHCHRNTDVSFQ